MKTSELKKKFYAAIEQNLNGQLTKEDTDRVTRFLYDCVREISDETPGYEETGDMGPKSEAHLDRFEMQQTLRQFGIEVAY